MKRTVRDILILLISFSGISFLYRAWMRRKGSLVRVIAFHDVADRAWFESLMKEIVSKYNPITSEQFHSGSFNKSKINILITFDDGYQTWIENVLPVLEKYGIKGLFFINSGLVDVAEDEEKSSTFMHDRLLISPKKAINWEGIKELINNGHTIGGHTATHPDLTQLRHGELVYEIMADKEKIENEIHCEIRDFAYPFGRNFHFNEEVKKNVAKAGYGFGFTAETGFFENKDILKIPRTLIEDGRRVLALKAWINGAYDVFSKLNFTK